MEYDAFKVSSILRFSYIGRRIFFDLPSFFEVMSRFCLGNSKFENGRCACDEGFVRVLGTRYCRKFHWQLLIAVGRLSLISFSNLYSRAQKVPQDASCV